jgi:hypothetical protein
VISLSDIFAACAQLAAHKGCDRFDCFLDENRFDTIQKDQSAQAHGSALMYFNTAFGDLRVHRDYCAGGAKFYVEGHTRQSVRRYATDRLDPMPSIWEVAAPGNLKRLSATWCPFCAKDPCVCLQQSKPNAFIPPGVTPPTPLPLSATRKCSRHAQAIPCPMCALTIGTKDYAAVKREHEERTAPHCECGGDKANTGHSTWCPKFS